MHVLAFQFCNVARALSHSDEATRQVWSSIFSSCECNGPTQAWISNTEPSPGLCLWACVQKCGGYKTQEESRQLPWCMKLSGEASVRWEQWQVLLIWRLWNILEDRNQGWSQKYSFISICNNDFTVRCCLLASKKVQTFLWRHLNIGHHPREPTVFHCVSLAL